MSEQRPDGYEFPEAATAGASAAVVDDAAADARPKHRGVKTGIAAVAAVALLGGGVAVADPFGWRSGGKALTVADVVPATADTFAEANLDPAFSQQVEMVRFALKFPSVKNSLNLTEQGDVKQEAWEAITRRHACPDVHYASDVKPWLGNQFGAATLGDTKHPVLVVQAFDEAKARAGMAKVASCFDWKHPGLAWRDGYLVASDAQSTADKAVADGTADPLSKRAEFTEDFAKVGTQGVASFWATRQGLQHLSATDAAKTESSALPGSPSAGAMAQGQDLRSMAGTLRFVDGTPEVRAVTKSNKTLKTSTTHTKIDRFPPSTTMALGISSGAQLIDDNWPLIKQAIESRGTSVASLEEKTHLKLPEDLKTLLGDDLRVGVGQIPAGNPSASELPVAVVSTSGKADLQSLLDRTQLSGSGVTLVDGQDNVVVGAVDSQWAQEVAAKQRKALADQDVFTAAYPTAEQAQFGFYVNLDAYKAQITKGMGAKEKEMVMPLQALGLSSHVEDANYGVMVARLTAK